MVLLFTTVGIDGPFCTLHRAGSSKFDSLLECPAGFWCGWAGRWRPYMIPSMNIILADDARVQDARVSPMGSG
eukprot:352431-Chlamydomonas_euryale.AAC.3